MVLILGQVGPRWMWAQVISLRTTNEKDSKYHIGIAAKDKASLQLMAMALF